MCRPRSSPMAAIIVAEFEATGGRRSAAFQTLSTGRSGRPAPPGRSAACLARPGLGWRSPRMGWCRAGPQCRPSPVGRDQRVRRPVGVGGLGGLLVGLRRSVTGRGPRAGPEALSRRIRRCVAAVSTGRSRVLQSVESPSSDPRGRRRRRGRVSWVVRRVRSWSVRASRSCRGRVVRRPSRSRRGRWPFGVGLSASSAPSVAALPRPDGRRAVRRVMRRAPGGGGASA